METEMTNEFSWPDDSLIIELHNEADIEEAKKKFVIRPVDGGNKKHKVVLREKVDEFGRPNQKYFLQIKIDKV